VIWWVWCVFGVYFAGIGGIWVKFGWVGEIVGETWVSRFGEMKFELEFY
jgi:hypothetical protein